MRALKTHGEEAKAIEIVNHDEQLKQLMQNHSKMIFNLCLRMTRDYFLAEDLTQDTFLAAWNNLQSFDGAHETAWLTKIASRKCLDYLRSAAARTTQPTEDETLHAHALPKAQEPENVFFEGHWDDMLHGACEELREPYRTVALGYYCEEKTLAQIARESGEGLDAIRSRCYRAKKMLQIALKEEIHA